MIVYNIEINYFIATGVPQSEKVAILETHNRLRAGVALGLVNGQPQAQNMEEMVSVCKGSVCLVAHN